MSNGLYSDMFVQAELDYRLERAMARKQRRAVRPKREHHSWHFHRKAPQHRQHNVAAVG